MDQQLSSSEYLEIFQFALRATPESSYGSNKTEQVPSSAENADFERIIIGIQFSRRFILSYQLVLLVLLLFFAARHWIFRFYSWRRRRTLGTSLKNAEISTHRSSSSSTLRGAISSPTEVSEIKKHERSPLLGDGKEQTSFSRVVQLRDRIRGWLIYQPKPIPIINKTLPSNRCTIAILAFISLQAFYVFYNITLSMTTLFVFADRTALVFVANLPLLYLLAAKNQPIRLLTGYSYESLNILHRRLGEALCLLALLHSVGMVGVWYTMLRPTGFALAHFLLSKIILLGLGALFAYEALYLTSLGSFRQRWYELFLGLHVFLQAAALVLVWFHHHGSRPYTYAALAIFFVDRCLYRLVLKALTTRASLTITEDEGTILVHAQIPLHRRRRWIGLVKSDITNGWKPTEHIFLSIPSLARKHTLQAHPFTIASKAPSDIDSDGRLDLIIRAHGGFSKDLVQYAKSHNSAIVRFDGPYGSQTAVELLQDCEVTLLIAGGSGIAVTWPLVWSTLESRKPTDPEFRPRLSKLVLFVWIMRQDAHRSWIGKEKLRSLGDAGADILIYPPTAEYGQPDLDGSVRSWIANHQGFAGNRPSIGIISSGPDGMNRSVRNLAASLVSTGHNVHVEIEKFGW